MRTRKRTLLVAIAGLALAACGGNQPPGEPQPATTLVVENQSTLDMTIYVLRGAARTRLGIATALQSTRMTIPREIMFGITALRFLADPIGSTRTPVTNEISVTPGDEVVLTIPPR